MTLLVSEVIVVALSGFVVRSETAAAVGSSTESNPQK